MGQIVALLPLADDCHGANPEHGPRRDLGSANEVGYPYLDTVDAAWLERADLSERYLLAEHVEVEALGGEPRQ